MPANRSLKVVARGHRLHGPYPFKCLSSECGTFSPRKPARELVAVCSRDGAKARDFAAQWGFGSHETDWRRLVERDDIDLIDIASPNDTHAEIAIAPPWPAKMVAWRKQPLGRTVAESRRMVEAVERRRRRQHGLVQLPARAGADAGQADDRRGAARPHLPQPLQVPAGLDHLGGPAAGRRRAHGGSTPPCRAAASPAICLAHCIDAALAGSSGRSPRYPARPRYSSAERMHALSGKREPITAEDASLFLARFANGSLATFEATRFARGHKALFTLEVNGEHGSIAWDLHDLHRLQFFSHHDEARSSRLALDPRLRRRPSVHEGVVGARSADRLRAHFRTPGRRFPCRPSYRREARAGLSRRACRGRGGGGGAAVGEVAALGGRRGHRCAGQARGRRLGKFVSPDSASSAARRQRLRRLRGRNGGEEWRCWKCVECRRVSGPSVP